MNKKAIYSIVGGVAVVVIGYFAYKKITAPTISFGEFDEEDDKDTGGTTNPTTPSNSDFLPLKKGSKGEKVKQLQRFLVAEGYNIGSFGVNNDGVDGDFGSITERAVKENQQPFAMFKSMYPTAVLGQVSKDFYNTNIKGRY